MHRVTSWHVDPTSLVESAVKFCLGDLCMRHDLMSQSSTAAMVGMGKHRGSHLASFAAETPAVLGLKYLLFLMFHDRNALQALQAAVVFGVPHPSTQTAPQVVQQPCHHQKGYGCSPTMEHLSETVFAKTSKNTAVEKHEDGMKIDVQLPGYCLICLIIEPLKLIDTH